MSKIYIVETEWIGINYYDGGGDCVDTNIEKIFDSEYKAAVYIQEKIREILEEPDEYNDYEYYINSVPSIDEIMKKKSITYYSDSHEESTYSYTSYEVE